MRSSETGSLRTAWRTIYSENVSWGITPAGALRRRSSRVPGQIPGRTFETLVPPAPISVVAPHARRQTTSVGKMPVQVGNRRPSRSCTISLMTLARLKPSSWAGRKPLSREIAARPLGAAGSMPLVPAAGRPNGSTMAQDRTSGWIGKLRGVGTNSRFRPGDELLA